MTCCTDHKTPVYDHILFTKSKQPFDSYMLGNLEYRKLKLSLFNFKSNSRIKQKLNITTIVFNEPLHRYDKEISRSEVPIQLTLVIFTLNMAKIQDVHFLDKYMTN